MLRVFIDNTLGEYLNHSCEKFVCIATNPEFIFLEIYIYRHIKIYQEYSCNVA